MTRHGYYKFQHKWAPYIFIAPFLIIFAIFSAYPLLKSLVLAGYITNGPKSRVFVGLGNLAFMLSDPDFYVALKNTVIFALFSVFLQLPLSLGLALLLNQSLVKGRSLFRLAFFSPHLVGRVFVGVMFTILFAPKYGLINKTIHFFYSGFPIDLNWLARSDMVMPALVLTALWLYVGFNMIYFLAALQAVDKNLYDAARVDGANALQRFWHVTLPGIKPVLIFVVILSTIGSFQLFELPYLMLNGTPGPTKAGLTIVMYLYEVGFVSGELGYASMIGWSLAIAVLILSLLQFRLSKRKEAP